MRSLLLVALTWASASAAEAQCARPAGTGIEACVCVPGTAPGAECVEAERDASELPPAELPPAERPATYPRRRDVGLLVAGGALFTVAWAAAATTTYVMASESQLYPVGFIPFAQLAAAVAAPDDWVPMYFGMLAATLAEFGGVALIVLGEIGSEGVPTLAVLPASPGADAGASLHLSF